MSFCMSNYARETMKMMFMMRSHHMLTDVIIEVQQELFHAHKVVLSAASPYFKAMFTGGLKESEMSRIKLQGVCPTAMGRILYFMYSGHIRVTELTVCTLLPAATMFQVSNVIDACCAFLERQLDPTNAIGIANFAEQHGCTTLKQRANQFIERHFTQISQEEEFLQLSAIQLVQLIRKDELNVQEEREVYNAVLKWVKYDEDTRYPKMEHILYAVRCQFLTPNFLKEQMRNCDVLKKVPACREYLARIFKDLTLHKRTIVRERTPNTTRMIFVAGGYFRHSLDVLEGFNIDDKTWTTLPRLRVPRSGLGAAFLKGTFYAVGGRNNSPGASYDSDWVDKYNLVSEQWRPCSPMSVPRNRVGVAVMDELLYAVGGSAGSEYHNSVEYYDPDEDRWTLVQPMHSKRLGVGVAVVNRLLYAIGGFDGNERLASIECYHPENNAWTILPPMKTGRSGAGVAALNQFIYVVGGFDGTRQLASVERYDTENQVWDTVAPIKIARSALSLTVLDGKLYAMGGFDGHSFLSIVEFYDPTQDKWEESTSSAFLSCGRSGHASAVIYQPSCANQYMDCVDDQVQRGKKPPPDDDENRPGPSNPPGCGGGGGTSKPLSQSASTSNQLHAFSRNRCTHCDDENSDESNLEETKTQRKSVCPDNQSKYEQECRDAIHCLLRMDDDKHIEEPHTNHERIDSVPSNDQMDISADEETNDYDSFNVDNPKKIRRKLPEPEEFEEEMGENSNSSCGSSNVSIHLRNRLKAKPNESGHCSLSKLNHKVWQNISDFVAWSSSSSSSSSSANPLPKAIPQDSNSNNLSNNSSKSNKNTLTEERKCDLLRKYYKCKLKYCNTSK
ncbi:kelch-like ECH-associated protein 1B isoform X2 [Sitodiplosis mosellana]|nr:kelch-like ECH-associated protein 1B isoform X2 [Sitodiplosis mosellana]